MWQFFDYALASPSASGINEVRSRRGDQTFLDPVCPSLLIIALDVAQHSCAGFLRCVFATQEAAKSFVAKITCHGVLWSQSLAFKTKARPWRSFRGIETNVHPLSMPAPASPFLSRDHILRRIVMCGVKPHPVRSGRVKDALDGLDQVARDRRFLVVGRSLGVQAVIPKLD
jgi:hypothetical protein